MTDPMELVGRLENIATGSFPYVASVAAEAAACIRELVQEVGALETTIDLMKMEIS